MRCLPLIIILLSSASASEPGYPLWDGHESVADYAKRINLPSNRTLHLGNGVDMEMVLIPAGSFVMGTAMPDEPKETVRVGQTITGVGSALVLALIFFVLVKAVRKRQRPKFSLLWLLLFTCALGVPIYGWIRWKKVEAAWLEYPAIKARFDFTERYGPHPTEFPAHPVTLTQPFYMSKTLVSPDQFAQGTHGAVPAWVGLGAGIWANQSWDDVQKFCAALNAAMSNELGVLNVERVSFRLPTEAEWEYACRAGTRTLFFSGDSEAAFQADKRMPNGFGLDGMQGNLWQWCQDWYAPDYYQKSPVENPAGPARGLRRVIRGGCSSNVPEVCYAAYRSASMPEAPTEPTGFRIVMTFGK